MGYGYHIDEGRLELPPAFKDLSVNVFEWSDEDREATVVIQRHAKSPSDAFADVVATLRQRLIESVAASWELEPLDLDVHPAEWLTFTARSRAARLWPILVSPSTR